MLEVAVQVLSVRDVFVPGTGCVLERVAAGSCIVCCGAYLSSVVLMILGTHVLHCVCVFLDWIF